VVVAELSADCNLACPVCPRRHLPGTGGLMEPDLFRGLCDQVAREAPGTVLLPFWRGESLVHPRAAELLTYALDLGLRVHLSTNGHHLPEEVRPVLARCRFVTFSVHTAQGLENARAFLPFRREGKPAVQVSFVSGEPTADLYRRLASLPDLGGFDSLRLYQEHTRDGVFGRSAAPPAGPRTFCPKLADTLVVSWDGGISRCNHAWRPEEGLALGAGGLREAWDSAVLRRVREGYPDEVCASCDQWSGHTMGEAWRREGGLVVHLTYGAEGP
jgi:hypothetical protein